MKDVRSRGVSLSQGGYARFAGLMYLVVLAFDVAGFGILSAIRGQGSFAQISHNVAASETLYRIGLSFLLAGTLSTILLAIGLYAAVKPVDGNLATTALLFRTAEAGIGATAVISGLSVLQIRLATTQASSFNTGQLAALADLISGNGTEVAAIFFSLGSAIFFYLFLKSRYIPKMLSAWGILASIVYAAVWFFTLVFPALSGPAQLYGSLPILIAELSAGFWLLVRGIRLEVRR